MTAATVTSWLAQAVDVDPADRLAWLDWRRGGIGASDIAGILGISPWASPFSVWVDKLGLLPEETPSNVMKAGRWLELGVAPWFAEETGYEVAGEQTACQHQTDPIARCTLDGAVFTAAEHVAPDGGLEIKVQGPGRAWETIPAHYQAQGQWQMHVTGFERVYFAVLHGRFLDPSHTLDRDQADIDFMVARAAEFWAEHVLAGVPPAIDGSDATHQALSAVYPGDADRDRVDLGHLADVIAAHQLAKADEKAAKERAQLAANHIAAALGDHTEGEIGGELVVSWRPQTRKSYVVAESTFRVLRHHAPKKEKV